MKALKDLLYGGRNEYLDIVRVLALLGGLTFLGLSIADFVHTGGFREMAFAGAWASMLGATTASIYARNRSDVQHRGAGDPPAGDGAA